MNSTLPESTTEVDLLRFQLEVMEQKVLGLTAQNRLLIQANQALGDVNRYYASLRLGRPVTDNEAFLHYIEHGGRKKWNDTHPDTG